MLSTSDIMIKKFPLISIRVCMHTQIHLCECVQTHNPFKDETETAVGNLCEFIEWQCLCQVMK